MEQPGALTALRLRFARLALGPMGLADAVDASGRARHARAQPVAEHAGEHPAEDDREGVRRQDAGLHGGQLNEERAPGGADDQQDEAWNARDEHECEAGDSRRAEGRDRGTEAGRRRGPVGDPHDHEGREPGGGADDGPDIGVASCHHDEAEADQEQQRDGREIVRRVDDAGKAQADQGDDRAGQAKKSRRALQQSIPLFGDEFHIVSHGRRLPPEMGVPHRSIGVPISRYG